jgi:hypothetical protein
LTDVPGLQKYRYTAQKYVQQVNIPIFEVGISDGITLLDLSEKDEILNVTLIPSGKNNSIHKMILMVSTDDVNAWDGIFYNPGYVTWISKFFFRQPILISTNKVSNS